MNRDESMSTEPQSLSNNINAIGELVERYGYETVAGYLSKLNNGTTKKGGKPTLWEFLASRETKHALPPVAMLMHEMGMVRFVDELSNVLSIIGENSRLSRNPVERVSNQALAADLEQLLERHDRLRETNEA
jgi:hypothetical protein